MCAYKLCGKCTTAVKSGQCGILREMFCLVRRYRAWALTTAKRDIEKNYRTIGAR